jgi:hypothetical protein
MAEWVGVESALGNFTNSAAYSGDASFLPAISQTLAFQVVPASTTVSLTASAASLPSTAQLQLTVNIQTESYASLSPTGTVTLLAGSSALASAPVYGSTDPSTGLAAAQAEFSLPASTLKNAANILTATYTGDSNYKNASSSPLTVTVFPSALPLLLSLSPAGTAAGGAAFTLTVNGANFNSTSVLLWNGELRPTSFVSTTQLTAAISAADVATVAANRITVANLSPNPAASSALPFAVDGTQTAAIILGSSIFNAADSSGDHSLALTGMGFVDAAAVQWNGASLTTSCVSPSQISATITAADFATRPAALTVSNPAGALSRFNLP